jgi:hypothetical protein
MVTPLDGITNPEPAPAHADRFLRPNRARGNA